MSVKKRDQLRLPKQKKPATPLTPSAEIYLPTYHFLLNEFQHARRHEKGILEDSDEEFIHQYRIALRRCRALISLLKPLFYKPQRDMLKNELKTLMLRTNLIRDLDVFLLNMENYFFLLDHKYHKGLISFFDGLQDKRLNSLTELKVWLQSENYEQQCQLIIGLLKEMKEQPRDAGKVETHTIAHDTLWLHFKQVESYCLEITPKSPDTNIHALRIECKKLRYLLEYFAPILPKKAAKQQITHLKSLQDTLGNFNDSSVQLAFLQHYNRSQKSPAFQHKAIDELIRETESKHQHDKKETIEQINIFRKSKNLDLFYQLYEKHKK